ncbi:carcinoembryonic antigen-related cell adhesion molecule 5 isoform X2 [Ictalurus punctatus]|uniref:Carcinoembryonic antigen-related cell adhesion molecule 5 isoform X2 n=1 Tax=Ictalurus punctatus TaxID=7998 RepID=A0A979EXE8_ICTPU|nr:carcinoembryonic antigen-related cell adhesion molecule 5 isoform X2 [Ictalurus punctatus]
MEFSPLAVMLLLISLVPVTPAQGIPKAVVFIKPYKHLFTCEKVTLRCDVQGGGSSEWTYSWEKNKTELYTSGDGFSADRTMQEVSISCVIQSDSGDYTCRGQRSDSQSSEISDAVTLTVSETPQPVLSISPQSWLTEGDSVTLSCEVTDSSTGWKFSWYRDVPYRDNDGRIRYRAVLLSDSSRGSGGFYTLSPAALNHTGVYVCRGERKERAFYTHYSNLQTLWITGESPPVSLIINPSRTQHFNDDSLSVSCEDQSNSTGWTVRRYTQRLGVSVCTQLGSVTGSTCNISSLSTSDTGVYWCESESGENSNPVNITVHERLRPFPVLMLIFSIVTASPYLLVTIILLVKCYRARDGDVILESPVHPVTEGHPLTLRCLHRNAKSSNLRDDFYKDGSVLQNQTTGEMIIYNVSKSDEGFYHCKHPERGASPKSWVSVRASGPSGVEAPFSVLMLISSVVTASPYLLVTIILLVKCYRARAETNERRMENAVIEE